MKTRFFYLLVFFFLTSNHAKSQINSTTKNGYTIEFDEESLNHYILISSKDSSKNGNLFRNEIKRDTHNMKIAKYHFEYYENKLVIERVDVYQDEKLIFSAINYKGTPL